MLGSGNALSRSRIQELLPVLSWAKGYGLPDFRADLSAGIVVFFLTLPQAVAYAFLAGLPAEAGLYAATLALLTYAIFGSSRTLAVGPTAIIAMMTLEAVSALAEPFSAQYLEVAVKLTFLTGVVLLLLRVLNFGAVISFLSHGMVTGFVTGAALLIMANQLPSLLGVTASGGPSLDLVVIHVSAAIESINLATLLISSGALGLLFFCKYGLRLILSRLRVPEKWTEGAVRLAPMYVVLLGILVVWKFGMTGQGVAVVGSIPASLPSLSWVGLSVAEVIMLLPSALLLAMLIFMEGTSVGTAVASKRRQKINPNQELVGLGMSNVGSALGGGFPVSGSFARTIVNSTSGAVTPVASLVTAALVVTVLLAFTSLIYHLPQAVLSAIILLSAVQLIDMQGIKRIFSFNTIDAITFSITFIMVLALGVKIGIVVGILLSFILLIRASSKPHIAVVGRWQGSEHFRNVLRHDVATSPKVLAVRIDESLYFVNTRYVETFVLNKVADSKEIEHVLLIFSAVNFVDSSGLEMLELLSDSLSEVGVTLHLSEVKGPVMDRLKDTAFYERMKGKVFFTTDIAMKELADT
jgi:SulP family sulfate permease